MEWLKKGKPPAEPDMTIADGFYFAKSIRILRYLLEHPEALEEPISTPVPVEVD